MTSIRGQVLEYMYIPTGTERELVSFGMNGNQKGQVVGTVGGGPVPIHPSDRLFPVSPT